MRVAAVQMPDLQGNISEATRRICDALLQADTLGVSIVCLPECFLQGYTLSNEETTKRALTLGSDSFKAILDKLSRYNAACILGMIEQEGGSFYNTAVVIQAGKLLGRYRKVHLFETNFTAGYTYPVFEVGQTTFGINICYDARFADGAKALLGAGAKLLFYPLNNKLPTTKAVVYRDQHITNLVERAKQTKCWVVSADIVTQEDNFTSYGCTVIISPDGAILKEQPQMTTGLVYADISVAVQN